MKYFVSLLLFIATLSSCSTYKPPRDHNVMNERLISVSYEDCWKKSIQWLSDKEIQIKNTDKSNGLIVAEGKLDKLSGLKWSFSEGVEVDNRIGDCGKNMIGQFNPQGVSVNIIITPKDSVTKVRINLEFSNIVPQPAIPMQCNSTGLLENDFFSYLTK